MPNTARTQQALAASPHFQSRLKAALAKIAYAVMVESPSVENHIQRASYARGVISNLDYSATQLAGGFVMRTNVFSFATTFDWDLNQPVTASGDADMESQLSTDWNILAGI